LLAGTPVVFTATPGDLSDAIARIRAAVRQLRAPKLYQAAFAATILTRAGKAQQLAHWAALPTGSARQIRRGDFVWAMTQAFGTSVDALLAPAVPARVALGSVSQVVLDLLYDAMGPLTLVARHGDVAKDALKLTLTDQSWIWNSGSGTPTPTKQVEYNPINSFGQQNGIHCALPLELARQVPEPHLAYSVPRTDCVHRLSTARCSLNGDWCASMDKDTQRATGKPRLYVPVLNQPDAKVLLPGAIEHLVNEATDGGNVSRPSAADMSLVASWCAANGNGNFNHTRLASILGAEGIRVLLETS